MKILLVIFLHNTTVATSNTSGALIVSGGISCSKQSWFSSPTGGVIHEIQQLKKDIIKLNNKFDDI